VWQFNQIFPVINRLSDSAFPIETQEMAIKPESPFAFKTVSAATGDSTN